MKKSLFVLALALPLLWTACDKDDDDKDEVSSGSANFSHYVAIGNSLTSGFMNNELSKSGQAYSYPNQLAEKMQEAGGGDFIQPYMTDDIGFGRRLKFDFVTMMPASAGETATPANFLSIAGDGPFNNMGVPGAKISSLTDPKFSLADTAMGGNPYYSRFAATPGTSTIMDEVVAQSPTFFSLWIGNNDILGYGLRGGDLTIGVGITPVAEFENGLTNVLNKLNGVQGVVANIPNILIAPYFTAVGSLKPYNSLVLDEATAASYNAKIAEMEGELTNLGTPYNYPIEFVAGQNAYLVVDPNSTLPVPYNFRQANETDLFLLSIAGDYDNIITELNTKGLGSFQEGAVRPIPHKYVLDVTEKAKILAAIDQYNEVISRLVAQHEGVYVVDMVSYMQQLEQGIAVQGYLFSPTFITGGFFSFDGIHPTNDGYGLITNRFIQTINEKFGSTLTDVDLRLITKKAMARK